MGRASQPRNPRNYSWRTLAATGLGTGIAELLLHFVRIPPPRSDRRARRGPFCHLVGGEGLAEKAAPSTNPLEFSQASSVRPTRIVGMCSSARTSCSRFCDDPLESHQFRSAGQRLSLWQCEQCPIRQAYRDVFSVDRHGAFCQISGIKRRPLLAPGLVRIAKPSAPGATAAIPPPSFPPWARPNALTCQGFGAQGLGSQGGGGRKAALQDLVLTDFF